MVKPNDLGRKLQQFIWSREQLVMISLAVLVGVLGGYGAVGFRWLITFFQNWFYGPNPNLIEAMSGHSWLYRIALPGLAGLVIGPFIYFLAREAKGHGVPEVMDAVALRGGVIRKRVVGVKSLASALSIAAGGSIGREGPIVQIGSAIGSSVGQIFKLSPKRMRVLVGCGAAAGIAATFNAPVAGMAFALEIILGEFAIPVFSPIVISAVMATAVSRHYLGDIPAFHVPYESLNSAWELLFHAVLGVLAGLVAVSFTTILYKVEDIFDAWTIPDYLKTPIAGMILGTAGLAFPWIMGVGYEGIEAALAGELAWYILLALVVIKILATSLTIGGGMSGGIFAPSLFIGAMLGGVCGHWFGVLFPDLTGGTAITYVIVGMAGVVAGTTHGPLSAFLILFEMTGDYKIILPLMIGTILAVVIAGWVRRESIYTLKLIRRGVDIRSGKEVGLLRSIKVDQVMTTNVAAVQEDAPLGKFIDQAVRSKFSSFPVVNDQGALVGILGHADYADHGFDRALRDIVVVKELATRDVVTVSPEDNLEKALKLISHRDFKILPVVSPDKPPKLLGVVSERDIISAYSDAIAKADLN